MLITEMLLIHNYKADATEVYISFASLMASIVVKYETRAKTIFFFWRALHEQKCKA